MELVAVFPKRSEFDKAEAVLRHLDLPYRILSPDPAWSLVGVSALLCDSRGLSAVQEDHNITCAGWADYRACAAPVPELPPARFEEDVFGEAAIMFFGPCMADQSKIRLIAHLGGDLKAVLPYINGTMPQAAFNSAASTLTYMDGQRLITLYSGRVTIGKADDLVDGWRTLEKTRVLVNQTWRQRASIRPSSELRCRPPALEIYKRLPRTNCRACGEQTCMAFASALWLGKTHPTRCTPVFTEPYAPLSAALLEIGQSLGLPDVSEETGA